jgi:site-specific DNA-cytosine methylase
MELMGEERGVASYRPNMVAAFLAMREVRRFRSERRREIAADQQREILDKLVSRLYGYRTQAERDARERTWKLQAEQIGVLLSRTPGALDPPLPQERVQSQTAPPWWGSMEGYAAAAPVAPELTNLARPELPPGWAYRGEWTNLFYYQELDDHRGSHPRTPEEESLEAANWRHIGSFRGLEYPRMGDLLQIQEQRRHEPPRLEVGEDENHPEPVPDLEDFQTWSPHAVTAGGWEELPQAFMVDADPTQPEQGAQEKVAYYREKANIWAGDLSPTRMFGEETWLTVLLLFGGIGAELEALLKAGVKIKRVLYVDCDPVSRAVFGYRLRALHHMYKTQLPLSAFHATDSALPWDIREVGERELVRQIGSDCNQPIDLVTVSSPCQGFSRANRQAAGLEDPRSCLVLEGYRVIALLQKLQRPHGMEPGYIFEMVDASDHASPPAQWGFQQMEAISGGYPGSGIRMDAAKVGSGAHRPRVFWTNLANGPAIQQDYNKFDRATTWDQQDAQGALDPFRTVQLSLRDDPAVPGYFRINRKGEPMKVFPTIVASQASYSYRWQAPDRPGPGMIYDRNCREWQEPNADERERLMGMLPASTQAPTATEADRRRLIGSAVDVRGYTWLCKAIRRQRMVMRDE